MDKKSDSIPIPGPSRLVQALTAIKTYDNREPNQVSYFFFVTFFVGFYTLVQKFQSQAVYLFRNIFATMSNN